MARACQHCGTALPAVVDAFCPECRADLSQTPQEVTDTARRTAAAITGTAEGVGAGYGRFYLTMAPLACCGAALKFVRERDWELATVALAGAIGFGFLWYWLERGPRKTVTGTSKTPKGSDTPQ